LRHVLFAEIYFQFLHRVDDGFYVIFCSDFFVSDLTVLLMQKIDRFTLCSADAED